ncbi:MAG: nuclear transport factor 2 family protein [Thermoleophilaceae bacterium]
MPDAATTERIRSSFEAFFRGDVDGAVAAMAPDIVGFDAPEMPDAGTLHGPDELRARLAEFSDLFEDPELAGMRIEDADDRTLVVVQVRARARAGGAPIALELAYVLRIRDDGLADELRAYFSEQAARDYLASR